MISQLPETCKRPGAFVNSTRRRLPVLVCGIMLVAAVACGSEARRLTSTPGDDDEPCFSPDGKSIVFQSRDSTGKPDLWIVGVEGGPARKITTGSGYNCFATWSPDAARIVFASDPEGEYDLYAIDYQDEKWSDPKRLTNTPRVREYVPAFSPDGKQIAFTAALPTGYRLGDNGVFVMSAAGEEAKKMTGSGSEGSSVSFDVVGRQLITSDHGAVEPTWLRDGKTIAYTWAYILANGHQMGVSMIAADAPKTRAGPEQQLRQLRGYANYAPAFSPTADVLALTLSKGDAWDIWLLAKPYTGQPVKLTKHPANDVNPAWSPDGKRIAFASNRAGNYDIYVIDVPPTLAAGKRGSPVAAGHVGFRQTPPDRVASWAANASPQSLTHAPETPPREHALPRLASLLAASMFHAGLAELRADQTPPGIIQRDWQQAVAAGEASEDPKDTAKWTVTAKPPEGKGLPVEPGPMIYADTNSTAKQFTYDPKLSGWHKVLIGFYLPPGITYTGVAARLSGDETFTCVADPRASLADRGKGYKSFLDADFVEVAFRGADLSGRKIVVHHPEGCWSYVTHFRFVPMTDEQIAAEKAKAGKRPLDVHLWLDILDYGGLPERPEKDWWQNSPKAMHRIARYFCDYGGNCLGHRVMGGGRGRYNSKLLRGERERYIDKRIGTDLRDPWAKYRYGDIEVDIFNEWITAAHFYGKKAFAVWPFEESHGYPVFVDSFNMEHPQLMSGHSDGTYQLACSSLAYPEVVRYKMAIAKELIERGIDGFNFDFQRIWGWYQSRDMTNHHRGLGGWDKGFDPPAIEAYQREFGVDPRSEPANNRRWIEFSTRYRTDFFRKLKELCDKSGRKLEVVVTIPAVSKDRYTTIKTYGCDWETLVAEGLVTAISPMIPPTAADGKTQTIDDAVRIMDYVHEKCRGKCRVIWPLTYYKRNIVGLANNSKLSVGDFTDRVIAEARRRGALGVNLTTVDYNMTDSARQLHIDTVMRLYRAANE